MADYSSLDIRQRSASTETPPEIRRQVEVAKLIDVSKCIGCKACQSACEEWNDLRDDIGVNTGSYQNPHDLVEDLKSRGFDKAGLYDPAGVGGTHVMYMLHHADQPSLYAGLPNDPKISPLVAFWKGGAKVFGLAAMGFAAVAGFFHYVTA